MFSPQQNKMRSPSGQLNDRDCWQRVGLFEQKIIRGNHDLLGFEPKLHSDFLHRVDRGPIHIGLASFTQSPIVHWNCKSFKQAFQRCRSAIRGGGLDNFGNQPAAVLEVHGSSTCWMLATSLEPPIPLPIARRTSDAGEIRSTCTCTVPGRPCCIGGLETRHNLQVPGWYDGCEFLAFSHHAAHPNIRDLPEPAVNRRTDET